ncbi:MAG: hypothetical protein C0467_27685 [Planctomycetaceae bacterium]|nr:hypothetical protein [Planctomycetaceae bacterium]
MDAVGFLTSPLVDLPKTRHGDYSTFIDRLLNDYSAQIQRIVAGRFIDQVITNELRRVVPLCAAVRQTIALLVRGDRAAAYNCLDVALQALGPHLRALMPSGDMSKFVDPIYRFRTASSTPYQKGDLFHIPFYLRHIVGPMRYSVAGLPSLYLGGSTHVCWRELGEPNLATVAVSRFHAIENTNLRILNFGHRLPVLGAYVATTPQDFIAPASIGSPTIAAHVACWPLIAACSIRVPDRAAPERPEYLLPQLMLEWITRTHRFHGIRYFSTHYSEYPDDPKTYMNYVIPARITPSVGYCTELCQLFELTDPVSWDQARMAPTTGAKRPIYKTRTVVDATLEADFGRTEDGLLSMPVGRLAETPDYLRARIRASVQARAYKIWESENYTHGRDVRHWFQAKGALGIPQDFQV